MNVRAVEPSFWSELSEELEDLKEKSLYRAPSTVLSRQGARLKLGKRYFLNFSSNNYLGLATHPRVIRKASEAAKTWGTSSGASRLISGNFAVHENLEKRLARFKKEEAAVLFSSGYLANLGAMTALLGEKDLVLIDRLNHASLIDAARLSRAKLWVYPHRDLFTLKGLLERSRGRFRRRLVATDAYFSMDGDVAPLGKISELCRREEALLMVDEAHSTGVFGKEGRGLSEHFGLEGQIDVVMGTLSKSLGSVGGYIAGKKVLRNYLVNRSREFIYTTGPSPSASAAAAEAISVIEASPLLRKKLWDNVNFLRGKFWELGYDLMGSEGPIIPTLIRDTKKVLRVQDFLKAEGILAPAIRPPTVPHGTDRIRFSVMATHTREDLVRLSLAMKKIKEKIL